MRASSALLVAIIALGCSEAASSDAGASGSAGASGASGAGAGGAAGTAGGSGSGGCPEGQEEFRGKCTEPERRYEPDEPLELDNVVGYGEPLETLELPEPPRSGFRLIVPPKTIGPGEEWGGCHAWAYPKLERRLVYAARLYTTGGLHHSNLLGVPFQAGGPSPYPACAPGQADVSGITENILNGEVPEVLFANSTQVIGEAIVFRPGMAFRLQTEGREAATNIHYLNTSKNDLRIEIAYDFFTMPEEELETELYPYYFDNFAFQVAPHTTEEVATTCPLFGGFLVSLMPHTHARTRKFTVDLIAPGGEATRIYEDGAFDLESDILIYDDPVNLEGAESIRHACTIENDLDVPIDYGIGTDEMCTLFGYLYPKPAQTIGVVQSGDACLPVNVGNL